MKYADEELLLDSSDTKESEGWRLTDVKNLSTAVSNAHLCEVSEKFLEGYVVLCPRLRLISYTISTLSSSFSPLNFTDLSNESYIRYEKDF